MEWHNVNIISNPGSALHSTLDVLESQVNLVNVYNLPKDTDLIIERQTFPATGEITITLPADLFDRWWASSSRWGEGIEAITASKEIRVTGAVSATIGAIPLEAAEKALVNLAFDGPAGLEFEARFRERIDHVTIGGVTYQWIIPDTTAPQVQHVTPAEDASEVALEAPLVITFDEPVSPLTFQLDVSDDPGGWNFFWNEDSTQVTAYHHPFNEDTTYTVSVSASDASLNPIAAPFGWSFTTLTEEFFIFLPLVTK